MPRAASELKIVTLRGAPVMPLPSENDSVGETLQGFSCRRIRVFFNGTCTYTAVADGAAEDIRADDGIAWGARSHAQPKNRALPGHAHIFERDFA
jgi:hypothetical protein